MAFKNTFIYILGIFLIVGNVSNFPAQESSEKLKPKLELNVTCEGFGGSQPIALSGPFSFVCGQPIHVVVTLANQSVVEDEQEKRKKYKEDYIRSIRNKIELPENFRYVAPEELKIDLPSDWRKYIKISFQSSSSVAGEQGNSFIPESKINTFLKNTPHKPYLPKKITRAAFFTFDLSPEETARLNPGKYNFTVSYEAEGIKSKKEVEVELRSVSDENLDLVDYECAHYYWYHKKLPIAIERTKRVINRNHAYKDYYSYFFLCELYREQKEIGLAIEACDQFLHFSKSNEIKVATAKKIRAQMKDQWK